MPGTWCVVALTRNTPDEFRRFVAWYLDLGASRIHLYFHDPEDANIALVEGDERIDVVRMTDALIDELSIERNDLAKMQDVIGSHAYSRMDADWLLRCDIDELLYLSDGKHISEILDAVPEDLQTLRFEMAEHLQGHAHPLEYRFRTVMENDALDAIYGSNARFLQKRMGMFGHRAGKGMSRGGIANLQIRTHVGRYSQRAIKVRGMRVSEMTPAYLLHFNTGDFTNWFKTIAYRIKFSSFDPVLAQRLAELADSGDGAESAIRALFRELNEFDEERFNLLKALGCGFSIQIDFAGSVARHFPGDARRLASAEAFISD